MSVHDAGGWISGPSVNVPALHLYAPGEWVCVDCADEWPCHGARERLAGQITDRRELRDYMVKCWRQACVDLRMTTEPARGDLFGQMVAWTETVR